MKQRKRRNGGFTMAELLIVVAIIGVLSGVAFAAVQQHQRSLNQLERNTAAKELYFAAQNHLTMAYAQGYLGVDKSADNIEKNYGKVSAIAEDAGKKVYYITNNGTSPENGTMLDIMLPFGSIEETVRSGGSYLIRYQPDTATVLDVFYCSTAGKPESYNHTIANTEEEYNTFIGYRNNLPGTGYIVGWYGGGEPGETGITLAEPTVSIQNGDQLKVIVDDTNINPDYNAALELIISGEVHDDKQAKMVVLLRANSGASANNRVTASIEKNHFEIILDDIKTPFEFSMQDGMHFADLNSYIGTTRLDNTLWFMDEATLFRPGENITIEAVAFSNSVLSNIAYSSAKVTNSLFADTVTEIVDHSQVRIANFRHLENLDVAVSDYRPEVLTDLTTPDSKITAIQIGDLSWPSFLDSAAKVYKWKDDTGANPGCFMPVNPDYALNYEGERHKIASVKVNQTGETGLFGSMTNGAISNLELIDFSVTSSDGNAGALAGTLTNVQVTNVLAHNTTGVVTNDITAAGAAGGLIGSMSGGSVEKSAAALIVNSTGGNAGGLIGTASGTASVTASYAGGHTVDKALEDGTTTAVVYDNTSYNVIASGVAGGLIGSAGDATIENCYSTCSAKGATVGGLVGSASGNISNSYCTGLVSGTTAQGAFAASFDGTASNCQYFEIINEIPDGATGYTCLTAIAKVGTGDGSKAGITALDATIDSYNGFVGAPGDWETAKAYNATLAKYYGADKYPLKTVHRLDNTVDVTDCFVATHYGDWPMPEIFVINTKP